ncbi:MAG: polyamine aminopropyltransferase [Candidatus Bipolaricaulis anaerobius]|nr:polyamine aminopropyltransferase [Candidatus Bipolaricaulis anaerobius]
MTEEQAPGVRFSLAVVEPILHLRTPHQELDLARTHALGQVLTLDGRIMVTERDEAFYHEMLVHPALLVHDRPERVLVVGGGDGGALRAVLSHPPVREVTLVEIDADVVACCRAHLAAVHGGAFDDPRVRIVISPAEDHVPSYRGSFDVVLVDSPDPIGPGRALFAPRFLAACRAALRPGGVVALQAGTPFYQPQVLQGAVGDLRGLFPQVAPYVGFVPSYPSGMWAYVLASERDLGASEGDLEERFHARGLRTRYYTPRVHRAAFVLPRFVEELVRGAEGR